MFKVNNLKHRVLLYSSLIILFLLFSMLSTSCSFISKYDPGFVQRAVNLENLELLKKGMTEQDALAIMGTPQIREDFHKAIILFYYTDWDWADAAVLKAECTPLVFENNKLIGWGLAFYRNYIHKEWLFTNEQLFSEENLGK